MSISIYSVIMAVIWFNAFVLLSAFLRRRTGFLSQFTLWPLIIVLVASFLRVLLPLEFSFTTILPAREIYPAIGRLWREEISLFGIGSLSVLQLVLGISLTISVCLIFRFVWKIVKERAKIRNLTVKDDPLAHQMLQDLINETKPGQKYTLIVTPNVHVPAMTGFFRPTIVLPYSITRYSEESMNYIIQHEWFHFVRKDMWIKFVLQILCCIMWWNPFMYFLRHDVNQTLELRCDRRVVRNMAPSERIEYLCAIRSVMEELCAEDSVASPQLRSAFISDRKGKAILQRLDMVMDYKDRSTWKTRFLFIVVMLFLFITSYVFLLQPHSDPDLSTETGPNSIIHDVTADNSYLIPNADGSCDLYTDGGLFSIVPQKDLDTLPHTTLPVLDAVI